jgi:hypothetical protein
VASARLERAAGRALGLASLGLGVLELAAPGTVQRLLGLDPTQRRSGVVRTLGVRELMHAFDLLLHADPTPGVWARVAGDGMDGAVLTAAASRTRRPFRFAAVSALVVGLVAADVLVARRLATERRKA